MKSVNCLCAEARAASAQAEIDRLNAQLEGRRRLFSEQCDVADTFRIRADELSRLLDEEREGKLSLIETISKMVDRETAISESLRMSIDEKDELVTALSRSYVAIETMASQIRDRNRKIADLRERIVENAEQARAIRIGVAA